MPGSSRWAVSLCAAASLLSSVACYDVSPAPQPEPVVEPAPAIEAEPTPAIVDAEYRYQVPAPELVAIVDAPPTPSVALAADGRTLLLADYPANPSIEVVAEPFLALAGRRINPRTNERQRFTFYDRLRLVDVASGETREITGLPERPRLSHPDWSPDGRKLAFTHTTDDRVELWVAEVDSGAARRLFGAPLNASFNDGLTWLSGSDRLLVRLIPAGRAPAPVAPAAPGGPLVEETSGRAATNRTYQDLLESSLDDALFTHYFTSELVIVDLDGKPTPLPEGLRGVLSSINPSPDGRWLLVERLVEPYSRVVPWYRFATSVELWSLDDPSAEPVVFAELPVADEIPIEGVRTGPRGFRWQPLEPATLVWIEALDEGDPRNEAEHRDKLLRLSGPVAGNSAADGVEFTRVQHRFASLSWLQQPGRYLISEYDRNRRWRTTHLRELDGELDRVLFDRSVHDRYADPGRAVHVNLPDDTWVVRVEGEGDDAAIFLDGDGASADGDRPFLDRLPLAAGAEAVRLFEAPEQAWATFVGFAGDTDTIVTRREAPDDPPDWFRESLDPARGVEPVALTTLPHPHPRLDGMQKRLLAYTRRDGVPLSGTLYVPPGFDPSGDERLPLMIWAYPREYVDADTAGQVRAAPTRFTRVGGTSATMLLVEGYAVLFAAMPVVGDPETMNDALLEQLVMSAEAAIDAAVEAGVADRDRVAVGGHSYGAFMVANLLAHSDLFKAGVARSGAYNRSLTPFGFQSERRTLWEAPDAYVRVSPLFAAAQIDEPILLIHGELDDNSGTFPLQTRRLFHALQGLGGTARMVILPREAHGYQARESVLHTLWETSNWLERHVKGLSPAARP
jgi:dipeptidyl aminopeptidase/acylaminoacyl peptidase